MLKMVHEWEGNHMLIRFEGDLVSGEFNPQYTGFIALINEHTSAPKTNCITIDLSGVRDLGQTWLQVFRLSAWAAQNRGRSMAFRGGTPMVRQIVDTSGLHDALDRCGCCGSARDCAIGDTPVADGGRAGAPVPLLGDG